MSSSAKQTLHGGGSSPVTKCLTGFYRLCPPPFRETYAMQGAAGNAGKSKKKKTKKKGRSEAAPAAPPGGELMAAAAAALLPYVKELLAATSGETCRRCDREGGYL